MDATLSRSETARNLAPTPDSVSAFQASCGSITVKQSDGGTDGTDGQDGTDGTDGTGGTGGQDQTTDEGMFAGLSSQTILLASGGISLGIIILALILRL